jgi:hypothetical protein
MAIFHFMGLYLPTVSNSTGKNPVCCIVKLGKIGIKKFKFGKPGKV